MKIVQIVHEFMPEFVGGTELYCNAVARELASRGHECVVLTGTQESRPAPELVTVDQEGLLVTRLVGSLPWPDRWSPVYRPAIVSDRGAPASRIGSAGLTFKAGDARDLAVQIRRVLDEPDLLERLRRGTPTAPPVPLEMHVAQLEEVYRQVIAAAEVAQCAVEERW